jgi:hypothetical protein
MCSVIAKSLEPKASSKFRSKKEHTYQLLKFKGNTRVSHISIPVTS